MRIAFMFLTLLAALLFYRFMDSAAIASSTHVIERQVLPMDVPFERLQARSALNTIREAMHMQTLSENVQLGNAAQAHADYLVLNSESTHDEIEGHKHFTGIRPLDRAFYAGYNAGYVSENLSTGNANAQSSVDGLFSAIYHRFGFLNPAIDEIGVGVSQDKQNSQNSAFVYVMGNSELNSLCSAKSFDGFGKYVYKVCREKDHRIAEKKFRQAQRYNKQNNPEIILYPYDGQTEVPPAFYAEVPDPLPDHEVSGFPISVAFNDHYFKEVVMESFKLFKADKEVVNVLLMDKENDPHKRFTDKQYALFPLERLEYDTEYSVVVEYSVKGKREKIMWTFTTKRPTEELHIVTEKEETIHIGAGRSHIIYFRPLDAHDIVKDIQFPDTVDIAFMDNNTFKLTLNDESRKRFDIVTDSRILHVKVDSQ